MLVQKKERIWNIGLHLFFVVIICVSALWGIERNTTITIIADEYGYWLPAAWLNGRDWSVSSRIISYYGYGYGCFILSIIMRLFQNVRLMYQMALVANAAMLVCNYFFAYKCWLKMVNANKLQAAISAFTVIVYSSNLLYAKMTLVEVFFSFLFWILVYLSISMWHSRIKKIFFCIILTILLASHNRGIGIVAAFVVSVVVCGRREDRKEYVKLFLYLVMGFTLWYVCKQYFECVLYADTSASVLAGNNIEGQASKVKSLLNINGIQMLLISFLGKSFYVLVSSFFIAGYGLIYLGKKIIFYIKQRNFEDIFPYLFIGLSFYALLGITVIFFAYYQGRADLLMYGRYHECVLGPIILFGLAEVTSNKNGVKETLFLVLIGILLSFSVVRYSQYGESVTNFGINCVGMSDLCYKYGFNENLIYSTLLRSILFCIIMSLVKNRKRFRNCGIYCCLGSISALWIYISIYDADERLYKWTEQTLETNFTFLDEIEKNDNSLTILYLFHAEDDADVLYLQFMRPDAKVIYIDEQRQLENLEPGTIVFAASDTENMGKIFSDAQYSFVSSNYSFFAWKKE